MAVATLVALAIGPSRAFRRARVNVALALVLSPSIGLAGTWTAFGPETVVRGGGGSTLVTRTFSVLNVDTPYTLRIRNGSSSVPPANRVTIVLNGAPVLGPFTLNPANSVVSLPVGLIPTNQLIIESTGGRGGTVTVDVVGVDVDLPTISASITPAPGPLGWLHSNATVTFICADRTSGVASCPALVTLSADGGNQQVTGTVTDRAGNQTSTSVLVNIDKTAPTITAAISPLPDGAGWNSTPATVTFACADSLSGLASCSTPVTVTTPGRTVVTGVAADRAGNTATITAIVNFSTSFFTLRNYGGKCLDFGTSPQPSGPVAIQDCNGSASQQLRVEEMNSQHTVRLHAGPAVLGFQYDPGASLGDPTTAPMPTEGPITLQPETDGSSPLANKRQFFVLDGDSLIAALNRNFVVEVQNARGANGTPVVLGRRDLSDAEFWDFRAVDESGRAPTTGFVRVETNCDLLRYLALAVPGQPPNDCPPGGPPTPAGPGTVIQIAPEATINLSGLYPLQLPAGVTLRGGRRGTAVGPRLCMAPDCDENRPIDVPGESMIEITGDDVRITGLRLEGPSRRTDPNAAQIRGIIAHEAATGHKRTIVDHNDISGWTAAGVEVRGGDASINIDTCDIPVPAGHSTIVNRNFIHHNRKQEKGYGVVAALGGFPLVEGNTFLANRHAIAANGGAHTGYRAGFNLVLSEAPLQVGYGPFDFYTHDFDQHGNGDDGIPLLDIEGFGGRGGLYEDIYRNTFLATNRVSFEIRAQPCHDSDIRQNVFLQNQHDALDYKPSPIDFSINSVLPASLVMNIQDVPNQFEHDNPTNRLAVGDFDGDGVEDLFLATGAAWYYAPAGAAEWRYLNDKTAPLDLLRFGDFDGDGRTDVVGVNEGDILVSWGGVSDWERLNVAPGPITDIAVGNFVSDFTGDQRDDLFYADGARWLVSSGGAAPFVETQTSSYRVSDLRFGDFDGDGATDVFGVGPGTWRVSYGAASFWTPLPVALTSDINGLIVADFDGDGRADVAKASNVNFTLNVASFTVNRWTLSISRGGATDWASHDITQTGDCTLTLPLNSPLVAGIGRVDGIPGADLLLWGAKDGNNLCVVSGGVGAAQRQSAQDMR
jgi:hypothetical protein